MTSLRRIFTGSYCIIIGINSRRYERSVVTSVNAAYSLSDRKLRLANPLPARTLARPSESKGSLPKIGPGCHQ